MAQTERKGRDGTSGAPRSKGAAAEFKGTGYKLVTGKYPSRRYKGVERTELTRAQELSAALTETTRVVARSQKVLDAFPKIADKIRVQPITTERYVDGILAALRTRLIERLARLADTDVEVPSPELLADLISAGVPAAGPVELDEHFADIGPFYDSSGAMLQLGSITKQALDSRRSNQTILAMQTGDGQWLYPAWQFTGRGSIHGALVPVLKALRDLDRWTAGVWLVAEHPDLDDHSPRQALREQVPPDVVAQLAEHDKATLVA